MNSLAGLGWKPSTELRGTGTFARSPANAAGCSQGSVLGVRVWISCPNSESWLRRTFGRSWVNWHVPFHVSHFSSGTLRQLLAETRYKRSRSVR
jgi:hypothetical protein